MKTKVYANAWVRNVQNILCLFLFAEDEYFEIFTGGILGYLSEIEERDKEQR